MTVFLRSPAWLLSICFFTFLLPICATMYGEIVYDYSDRPAWAQALDRLNGLPILMITGLLLYLAWLTAILVKFGQGNEIANLLIIPGITALLFVSAIMPFAVEHFVPSSNLASNLVEAVRDLVSQVGERLYFSIGFGSIGVTWLAATFAVGKMTTRSWRDWLWIPFAMLLFPIGVFFVQPRLRRLLDRKSVTETEDHFLDA